MKKTNVTKKKKFIMPKDGNITEETLKEILESALGLSDVEQQELIDGVKILNIAFAIILTNGSRDVKELAKCLNKIKGTNDVKFLIHEINRLYPVMVDRGMILENGTLTMEATVQAMMFQDSLTVANEAEFNELMGGDDIAGTTLPHFGPIGQA